jgi:hypothetical protein
VCFLVVEWLMGVTSPVPPWIGFPVFYLIEFLGVTLVCAMPITVNTIYQISNKSIIIPELNLCRSPPFSYWVCDISHDLPSTPTTWHCLHTILNRWTGSMRANKYRVSKYSSYSYVGQVLTVSHSPRPAARLYCVWNGDKTDCTLHTHTHVFAVIKSTARS